MNLPPKVKILRTLPWKEYAKELGEGGLTVWVNPPLARLQEHDGILKERVAAFERLKRLQEKPKKAPESWQPDEAEVKKELEAIAEIGKRFTAWYCEIWSQGSDPDTHVDVNELLAALDERNEDPRLLDWMEIRTLEMIHDHRLEIKNR